MDKLQKVLLVAFVGLILLTTSGCISAYVVKSRARPHLKYDSADGRAKPVDGEPAYYALLPLTIIGDVATAPFQILYFSDSHGNHMWVDGWPVPLP